LVPPSEVACASLERSGSLHAEVETVGVQQVRGMPQGILMGLLTDIYQLARERAALVQERSAYISL
jgi:hypothetical protein